MTDTNKYVGVAIDVTVDNHAPSQPSSSRRCRKVLICLALWVLMAAASVATFGGIAWRNHQQRMNKDIRSHILAYPLYPPPDAKLSCRESHLSPTEQYNCHLVEASARYEQWNREMLSTSRDSSKFESLIQPHLSAFAYHVHYSAFADPPLTSPNLPLPLQLPLNISVWETRLRIERYPHPRQRHVWMDLVTIQSMPPHILRAARGQAALDKFLAKAGPMSGTMNFTMNLYEATIMNAIINSAISHWMNQAAALCEPDKISQSSSRRSDAEVDYFIDNRKGSIGKMMPWSRVPGNADSMVMRAALGSWLRSELFRLGIPLTALVPFKWNQYVLKATLISGSSLQEQSQRHNYSIPTCLFRPATAEQLAAASISDVSASSRSSASSSRSISDIWYYGPQVTIVEKANRTGNGETDLDKHQRWVLTHLDVGEEGSKLLRADNFTATEELGSLSFVRPQGALTSQPGKADDLEIVGEHSQTVEWSHPSRQLIWYGVETDLRLHSGSFRIEFAIEALVNYRMQIGFVLASDPWPDWDFFGILGASTSAWAYDPSAGSVTFAKQVIASGLNKTDNTGTVTLQLDLPENTYGRAQFIVNGTPILSFLLPRSSVAVPAVSLGKYGQRVRLSSLDERAVSVETMAAIQMEVNRLLKI